MISDTQDKLLQNLKTLNIRCSMLFIKTKYKTRSKINKKWGQKRGGRFSKFFHSTPMQNIDSVKAVDEGGMALLYI